LIIHRYGRLTPGDRIVLVATASRTAKPRSPPANS
jgi:molybdopterin synthase catalytic subunit